MSERKVINKYYPPDFDPSLLTKRKKPKKESAAAQLQTVRLMAPFSMRCTHCGEFVYRGKKFNARKQPTGESYLGVKIVRFYIKCPRCSGEIRFKTDPKTADYVTEFGAERNHEPWREKQFEDESLEQRLERLEQEEKEKADIDEHKKLYGANATLQTGDDPMADLEARVESTKKEIIIQNELDRLRTRNARIERATVDEDLLDKAHQQTLQETHLLQSEEDKQDELSLKKAFRYNSDGEITRQNATPVPAATISSGIFKVKKLNKRPVSGRIIKKPTLGVVVKKKASLI